MRSLKDMLLGYFRSRGCFGLPAVVVRGRFRCRILNPDGSVAEEWVVVPNAATTAGLNAALETIFRTGTQYTTWYIGLINASGFSAVAAADTIASHAGWSEFTGYTESTRRQWSPGAASGGSVVNGSVVQFTNGGSAASIQGMFLVTDSTKGGTAGVMWSTAAEASPRSLTAGQVFQAFYEADFTPVS